MYALEAYGELPMGANAKGRFDPTYDESETIELEKAQGYPAVCTSESNQDQDEGQQNRKKAQF